MHLLQQQVLDDTIKPVVFACECDNVTDLEEDPSVYFNNEEVRVQIEDCLRPEKSTTMVGLLMANNDTLRKVVRTCLALY